MKYIPLADRVIVEPAPENRVSRGGIVVPDVAQNYKYLQFGTVVAHGPGRANAEGKLVPLNVKQGDVVAFPRKEGAPIPLQHDDGSEFTLLLLREAQIIAIVEDLPRATPLVDVAGAPLSIVPSSRALPDSAYENRDGLDRAKAEGWLAEDIDDHTDEPYTH